MTGLGFDDTMETGPAFGRPRPHWSSDVHRSSEYMALRKQFREACRKHRNGDGSFGAGCHICGNPIDYRYAFPHPMSWSLAHYRPVRAAPELALSPSNFRASHLRCNQTAGSHDPDDASDLDIGEPSEIW
jgi:hypothetical protein